MQHARTVSVHISRFLGRKWWHSNKHMTSGVRTVRCEWNAHVVETKKVVCTERAENLRTYSILM